MCQFCDPRPVADPVDMAMGDKRSFTFFSMAAIDEAIRATSGGCTPICDHHRAMFFGGSQPQSAQEEEKGEESEEESEGQGGDCDDEYDGT